MGLPYKCSHVKQQYILIYMGSKTTSTNLTWFIESTNDELKKKCIHYSHIILQLKSQNFHTCLKLKFVHNKDQQLLENQLKHHQLITN
jgi:hypothetical protein